MANGKIKTLYSDKEKTEVLFPRTKVSAVSDGNGRGLDSLLENLPYFSDADSSDMVTVPMNADTLGGRPAGDYATQSFVTNKIAEAQVGGSGNIDLSGYATKDDLNTKQNTITGAATTITGSNLTASRALVSDANGKVAVSDVTSTELGYLDGVTSAVQTQLDGKAASSHNHSASNITSGTLGVARGGTGKATHTSNAVLTGNGTSAVNNVATANGALYATAANGAAKFGTLPIAQGGTGATSATNALKNLGAAPAGCATNGHDTVTAQGTSGIWTYRKWASGIAECWGSVSGNITGTHTQIICYPPFEFVGTPTGSFSIQGASDSFIRPASSVFASNFVDAWFDSSVTTGTYLAHFQIKGRWK